MSAAQVDIIRRQIASVDTDLQGQRLTPSEMLHRNLSALEQSVQQLRDIQDPDQRTDIERRLAGVRQRVNYHIGSADTAQETRRHLTTLGISLNREGVPWDSTHVPDRARGAYETTTGWMSRYHASWNDSPGWTAAGTAVVLWAGWKLLSPFREIARTASQAREEARESWLWKQVKNLVVYGGLALGGLYAYNNYFSNAAQARPLTPDEEKVKQEIEKKIQEQVKANTDVFRVAAEQLPLDTELLDGSRQSQPIDVNGIRLVLGNKQIQINGRSIRLTVGGYPLSLEGLKRTSTGFTLRVQNPVPTLLRAQGAPDILSQNIPLNEMTDVITRLGAPSPQSVDRPVTHEGTSYPGRISLN